MARQRGVYKNVNGAIYKVLCVDTETKVTAVEDLKLGRRGLTNNEVMKIVSSYLPRCMRPVAVLGSEPFKQLLFMPEEIYLAFAQPVKEKDIIL